MQSYNLKICHRYFMHNCTGPQHQIPNLLESIAYSIHISIVKKKENNKKNIIPDRQAKTNLRVHVRRL